MPVDHIRYDILTQEALRSVVRTVLTDAASNGLPGEHHFYIAFKTDAPGVMLQLLAVQPPDAPFIAIFDIADLKARRPERFVSPAFLAHANGATRIVRATFMCPGPPPFDELDDLRFGRGEPRLDLDLGGTERSFVP